MAGIDGVRVLIGTDDEDDDDDVDIVLPRLSLSSDDA